MSGEGAGTSKRRIASKPASSSHPAISLKENVSPSVVKTSMLTAKINSVRRTGAIVVDQPISDDDGDRPVRAKCTFFVARHGCALHLRYASMWPRMAYLAWFSPKSALNKSPAVYLNCSASPHCATIRRVRFRPLGPEPASFCPPIAEQPPKKM